MGNPDEQVKSALSYYEQVQRKHDRDHRVGGLLASLLLCGLAAAVILAIVLLILAVF